MNSTVQETINIKRLCNAIYYWLNYYHTVSISKILLESSIRFPFTELLERTYGKEKTIVLEQKHPKFITRHIDFCIKKNDEKDCELKDDGNYVFFEMKYVHDNSEPCVQKYYNDIIRLAFVKNQHINSYCFFVCCGDSKWFYSQKKIKTQTLKTIPSSSKPKIYERWLSFSQKKRIKKIKNIQKNSYSTNFKNEYHIDNIPFNEIETELWAIEGNKNIQGQAVAIWLIK